MVKSNSVRINLKAVSETGQNQIQAGTTRGNDTTGK